ncbi:MAG: DUF421 domain-containing protein [Acidobacteria bacterium]|nr:DUF421 domain-containing protein [Acidobacteriota bacterium]
MKVPVPALPEQQVGRRAVLDDSPPIHNEHALGDLDIQDGEFIPPHLRKEGVDRGEVEIVLREYGLDSVAGVRLAVLETDGSISIVPASSRVVPTRRRVRQLRKR